MTIRVHLAEGPWGNDNLKVFIVNHRDDGKELLRFDGDGVWRWEDIPADGSAIHDPASTFELPWDTGRALLEALTRHYSGAEDTRALRRDYDAERKRVDQCAEVIADIARSLAIRSAH